MPRSNAKLKPVEPTLEEQLTVAIAEEKAASKAFQVALKSHQDTFGEYDRLLAGGIKFVPPSNKLSDAQKLERAQPQHTKHKEFQERQRASPEFNEQLAILRYRADQAAKRVRHLELTIAERVEEGPARAELAGVLSEITTTIARIASLAASTDSIRGMVAKGKEGVAKAEAALAAASADVDRAMSDGLSDFLREEPGPPAQDKYDALKAARDRKIQAADDLEMAAKALSIAERRLGEEENKASRATAELETRKASASKLAHSIATTTIPRLLEEARAAQLELEGRRQVLLFLSYFASTEYDREVNEYLGSHAFPFGSTGSLDEEPQHHPAVAPWLTAIAALAVDAGAPLPKA